MSLIGAEQFFDFQAHVLQSCLALLILGFIVVQIVGSSDDVDYQFHLQLLRG